MNVEDFIEIEEDIEHIPWMGNFYFLVLNHDNFLGEGCHIKIGFQQIFDSNFRRVEQVGYVYIFV